MTRTKGVFVDSHLLPKALTKADGLGPGLLEFGYGRTTRRFSSWYDQRLVTKAGEDILSSYDDWAISLLRRYKLVWSGWGPIQRLEDHLSVGQGAGMRVLKGGDWKRLRLFFLSLLWRGAASDRQEFNEITIPDRDLEQLRLMVLDRNPVPLEFYPISLTQLSTLGRFHNHAPIADVKAIPNLDDAGTTWNMPYFRFYLDGLIAHISRLPPKRNKELDLGAQWVGSHDENLIVSTVPWEGSAQQQNGIIVTAEAMLGRPLWELGKGPFTAHMPPCKGDQ